MLYGSKVADEVIRVIGKAQLGDDAGSVNDLGGQHDGLAEVVLAAAGAGCTLGVHIGDADAALMVRLKALAGGYVVEHCSAHRVVVAQKVDKLISLGF